MARRTIKTMAAKMAESGKAPAKDVLDDSDLSDGSNGSNGSNGSAGARGAAGAAGATGALAITEGYAAALSVTSSRGTYTLKINVTNKSIEGFGTKSVSFTIT